jgi:hypothetical protein
MATWPYRSDLDFVLEADDGTPAAFALGWYDDANGLAEFSDGTTLITGALVQDFANTETGTSVVENISGPATVTPPSDGGFTLVASGPQGLGLFPTDVGEPAALLIHGRFVLTASPTGTITDLQIVGTVENLCDVLAP